MKCRHHPITVLGVSELLKIVKGRRDWKRGNATGYELCDDKNILIKSIVCHAIINGGRGGVRQRNSEKKNVFKRLHTYNLQIRYKELMDADPRVT